MHMTYRRTMRHLLPLLLATILAAPAHAECYAWPLRGDLAYDGDSPRITMPGLPPELAKMEVRAAGIDTPEMHGKCQAEKDGAQRAAQRMRGMLAAAVAGGRPVLFCDPVWDKYGGRVRARVMIDGKDVADTLIGEGLAKPYGGGHRDGWCGEGN
jgi:endonuclease YncB( thermonuclease family)